MKVFNTYNELKDYYIRNWVMQKPGNEFYLVDENDERVTSWDYYKMERNLMVKGQGVEYWVLKKD